MGGTGHIDLCTNRFVLMLKLVNNSVVPQRPPTMFPHCSGTGLLIVDSSPINGPAVLAQDAENPCKGATLPIGLESDAPSRPGASQE